jgi:ribosomal protein S27E
MTFCLRARAASFAFHPGLVSEDWASMPVDSFGPESRPSDRPRHAVPGRGGPLPDLGPVLEAFLPPWRECIVPGIRSGRSSTGFSSIISTGSWPSMRAVSSGSTGFAVLRREANEGGFFRPIVKEVVERYLDCGNPRSGFARLRCPDCREERLVMFSCRTRGFCPSCHAKRLEEWGEWMRETLLLQPPEADLLRGEAAAVASFSRGRPDSAAS